MRATRLWFAAAALAVAAVALAPATCSLSSDDDAPRCETALGYWTPFGEWLHGLLLLALLALAVIASARYRKAKER